jgi:hypothetical protein
MGNDNVRYFVKGKMMEEVDSMQDCRIMFSQCHTHDSQQVSCFLCTGVVCEGVGFVVSGLRFAP